MPAQIHVNQGKARLVIPSRGGIAAIGGSQVPSAFGEDGREVQLQKSATHIQWRYEGDAAWTNLVALSELEGDPGAQGETGPMPYDYRGAWDGYTSYGLYDAVTYQGSLYWLPATGGWTIGGAPPAYNWELLVSKGDTGEQGETGKSAYQSYLDTTADDPVLTEEQWSEGGGGGGDYLPLAGGTMDANASIIWGNASAIREAGAQGLEIECSVGYRWQWVAGRMILRQINSGQIQRVLAIDGVTPGNTEDISEGFITGTRWETQDGTIYECTDSTDGAAVWENITPIPISTPGVAYVNSGGDDSTGAISDPSKPYLTAQAAWDDGARNIEFGVGSYSITHISSPTDSFDIFFRGAGKEVTTLDFTFTGEAGGDHPDETDFGQNGGDGAPGVDAGSFTLSSDKSLSINLATSGGPGGKGGKGGPGSVDPEIVGGNGGLGGDAGDGPTFEVFNCVLASQSNESIGGQAGEAGDANGYIPGVAGAAGANGALGVGNYYWCDLTTPEAIDVNSMYSCLRDGRLFATVPSSKVEYSASTVEAALNDLFNGRVEIYRVNDNNFTTSSTTVSSVPNFACPIAVGEQLTIEIFGFHTAGTGGMKLCFSGPASPTFLRYNFSHWTSVTAMRSPISGAATSFDVDLSEGSGSSVVMPFNVLLTVKNGANGGVIQCKMASVTGGQTLTVMRESFMRVTR